MLGRTAAWVGHARRLLPRPGQLRTYASEPQRHNQAIVDTLIACRDEETQKPSLERNMYRIRAFQKAIDILGSFKEPIHSISQIENLKGIGPGIIKRVQLKLEPEAQSKEGQHKRSVSNTSKRRVVTSELQDVLFIGPSKAKSLVEAGCTSVMDLQLPKYQSMLTEPQRIGAKYHFHLTKGVSRPEAERVLKMIKETIPPSFEVILGGSYRRGSSTSSDIDVLLFHPDNDEPPLPALSGPESTKLKVYSKDKVSFKSKHGTVSELKHGVLAREVLAPLKWQGLLADTMSAGPMKWQGIVRVPKVLPLGVELRNERVKGIEEVSGDFRKMDINFVPMKSRAAALLALTGDVEFNRDTRIRALHLGLHLNEFGLWRWKEDTGDAKTEPHWEMIKAETEQDLLMHLGMEYVAPEKRNFSFISKPLKKRGRKPKTKIQ